MEEKLWKKLLHENKLNEDSDKEYDDAYKELIEKIELIRDRIPKALKQLKQKKIGFETMNLVANIADNTREDWYRILFK